MVVEEERNLCLIGGAYEKKAIMDIFELLIKSASEKNLIPRQIEMIKQRIEQQVGKLKS